MNQVAHRSLFISFLAGFIFSFILRKKYLRSHNFLFPCLCYSLNPITWLRCKHDLRATGKNTKEMKPWGRFSSCLLALPSATVYMASFFTRKIQISLKYVFSLFFE